MYGSTSITTHIVTLTYIIALTIHNVTYLNRLSLFLKPYDTSLHDIFEQAHYFLLWIPDYHHRMVIHQHIGYHAAHVILLWEVIDDVDSFGFES